MYFSHKSHVYSIYLLKVSGGLLQRVVNSNNNFEQEMVMEPREPATFDYKVRSDRVIESIEAMNLCELKGMSPFHLYWMIRICNSFGQFSGSCASLIFHPFVYV